MAIFKALKSIASPVFGAAMDAFGQHKANKANAKENRLNREFQERMSSTAYQRSADDLEAAGLNRILALGSPASTPGGNVASYQNTMGQAGEIIAKADLNASAASLAREDKKLRSTQNSNTQAQTDLLDEQQKMVQAQTATAQAQARSADVDATTKEELYDLFGVYGNAALQVLGSGAGSVLSAGVGVASGAALQNRNNNKTPGKGKGNRKVVRGEDERKEPTVSRNKKVNPHPKGTVSWFQWENKNRLK